MKENIMQPIGYFLLLFSCISTNMTHSMDFSMQERQPHPEAQRHALQQSYFHARAQAQAKEHYHALKQRNSRPSPRRNPDNLAGCQFKYTYTCPYPYCKNPFFSSTNKIWLRSNLIMHVKRAQKKGHPPLKIEACMRNVKEPENLMLYTAPCPYRNSCDYAPEVARKENLIRHLANHLRYKHQISAEKFQELVKPDYYEKNGGKTIIIPNPNFVHNPN